MIATLALSLMLAQSAPALALLDVNLPEPAPGIARDACAGGGCRLTVMFDGHVAHGWSSSPQECQAVAAGQRRLNPRSQASCS